MSWVRLVGVLVLVIAGCGGGGAGGSGGSSGSGGTTAMGGANGSGGAGGAGGAGTGGVAGGGGPGSGGAAFIAITPCDGAGAYVAGQSIVTSGESYSPACLRVQVGQVVTIEADAGHPLAPRAGGSAGNPIPANAMSTATLIFPTPGFYPFLCTAHAAEGMVGVVWVTP